MARNAPKQQIIHQNTKMNADRVRNLSAQLVAISAELLSSTIPPTSTIPHTVSDQISSDNTKTRSSPCTCGDATATSRDETHYFENDDEGEHKAYTSDATTTVNGSTADDLIKDMKEELTQLRAEKVSADAAANQAKEEKQAIEQTLSHVSQERDELLLQAFLLEKELARVRKEHAEKMESQNSQLRASIELETSLQETIQDLREEVETLEKEVETLEKEVETLEKEVETLEKEVETLENEVQTLKTEKKMREPLLDVGVAVRMAYVQQMIGAHTTHSPSLRITKAGDNAANRANVIADNCLLSLGYCSAVEKQVLQMIHGKKYIHAGAPLKRMIYG